MKFVGYVIFALLLSLPALAQTATLRGQVTDESGAIVPGARVELQGPSSLLKTTKAGNDGSYFFGGLAPGDYVLRASAPQLAIRQPAKISLRTSPLTVNLVLYVSAEKQEVTVEENAKPIVSTEASANASAVVLRGTDLDALSDNPDDLAADLQALAGPAAGPNGGSILIDGFSGGELPPKNSIREIRINQNPFSPEYDKLGLGRIEIFTKPGTDRFHADFGYNFATDKWNSRNAYAAEKAPFHLHELRETVSGPLGKRASFNLNFIREWVDNGNVVNAVTLDPQTLQPVTFTDTPLAELAPHRRYTAHRLSAQREPHVDRAVHLQPRYRAQHGYRRPQPGIPRLSQRRAQPDAATHGDGRTPRRASSTKHASSISVPSTIAQANSPGPALQVLGSFNGGGNPIGHSTNTQNNYEFQNNTSMLRGAHTWRFGVRVRGTSETSVSPQNYAGTFTFSGGLAVPLDGSGQPLSISSIESYRRTLIAQQQGIPAPQIRQLGGGASQFSMNAGNPQISGSQVDLGAFVGDDWKVRPNLTLNLGLRYETQSNIHDWRDFAPRIGVAWAPGASAKIEGEVCDSRRVRNVLRPLQPRQHAHRAALRRRRPAAICGHRSGFLPHGASGFQSRRLRRIRHDPANQFKPPRALSHADRRRASSANCRSTRRSRSPSPIRTGCTCCVHRTSTPRFPAPTSTRVAVRAWWR